MWHKNRYAFTVKFDLCVFSCFGVLFPALRKFASNLTYVSLVAVLVFALKRRLRFGFGIKYTRLIKFALIAIAG